MNRRRYLVVAVAAVSSVAGCSQASDGNNEQESKENTTPSTTARPETTTSQDTAGTAASKNTAETPKETVRSFLTAVYAGEVQAANALIHPDGNASEYTEDAAERNEALDLTIQSVEIIEESEDTATVTAVVSLENSETDEELTRSQTYILQTDDSTWKLYDSEEDEAA
jgi:uncharacterized protein YchJ